MSEYRFSSVVLILLSLWIQQPARAADAPTFNKNEIKPFRYLPADPAFWSRVTADLKDNNPIFVLQESLAQEKKFSESSTEVQEAKFAEGLALEKMGFTTAAFTLLMDLASSRIGTSIGEASLFELDTLAQNHLVDDKTLEGLLVENEFAQVHPDIKSFISYFKAMFNLRYGYSRWADPQLSTIKTDNPWHLVLDYWTAVGEVARNRTDKAFAAFTKLNSEKSLPPKYQALVHLQLARLQFEKGQFAEAETLYRSVDGLGLREHGRILLERTWTAYYLKDYSRALGLLRAMKNEIFNSSITPERYTLEMLIDRDLCHFEAVDKIAKQFTRRFAQAFDTIHKRRVLHENRELFYMATLNRDIQERANLVDDVRKERTRFKRAGLQRFRFYDDVLDEYGHLEKVLLKELEPQLEKYSRKAAENLLDAQEQIQFLQYTSKLDALRIIKPEEDRAYKQERISHVKFKKIFWPAEKEFWFDEQDDIRVLLASRCGIHTTPQDLKLEREFR